MNDMRKGKGIPFTKWYGEIDIEEFSYTSLFIWRAYYDENYSPAEASATELCRPLYFKVRL